jgi:putative addiction module killer protein
MITILMSDEFDRWLSELRDRRAQARIVARIRSAGLGNFGDIAPVGEGISEMRVHHGPGYRIYYARRGDTVFLLLVGGDKSTQRRDIQRAKHMLATLNGKNP